MTGKAVRRLMALAVCAVLYAGCGPQNVTTPPSPPAEEDPVTRISVPGAYGVPGGDQILQPARQTGALYYGNSFTFRILDPSTLTVVSLSGIPRDMKEGSSFSLYYRLSKDGKTLQSVAEFVSSKLSPMDSVLSTSTHFVLKKYKEHGLPLVQKIEDERMLITP